MSSSCAWVGSEDGLQTTTCVELTRLMSGTDPGLGPKSSKWRSLCAYAAPVDTESTNATINPDRQLRIIETSLLRCGLHPWSLQGKLPQDQSSILVIPAFGTVGKPGSRYRGLRRPREAGEKAKRGHRVHGLTSPLFN